MNFLSCLFGRCKLVKVVALTKDEHVVTQCFACGKHEKLEIETPCRHPVILTSMPPRCKDCGEVFNV